MEVILEKSNDEKLMKFRIIGEDHTLLNALREKLLSYPEVEYAYYNLSHPLKSPYLLLPDNVKAPIDLKSLQQEATFVFRVKEGNPKEILKKAVNELFEEAEELTKIVDRVYKEHKK
ncbi:MAG: hypothetical protein DRN30_01490 [Thermoplasmata archaeon]|nr:hypothetical protein [Euryarchaeota archaeon]RLF66784.1 MAG: hypothetical protein DRN30_01490 [Thermoplasmata archaeon]